MNQRYGWRVGSNIAEAYINAAGIPEEENVEAVEHNKVIEMERQMRAIQQRMKELEAERDEYRRDNETSVINTAKAYGVDIVERIFKEGWDEERIKTEMKNWQEERNKRIYVQHREEAGFVKKNSRNPR